MSQCQFIKSDNLENNFNGENNSCKFRAKYGCFCYKHRGEFLIVNNEISQDRFTGLSKDYLKLDLVRYRKNKMRRTSVIGSKDKLFDEIKHHITSLNGYHEDNKVKEIISIQSLFRGKYVRDNINNLKCNNEEDFYTFDLLKEIPCKYFYSYIDQGNIRWGFDIRSLDKLISMNYSNPYTTGDFPEDIIIDIKSKILFLKNEVGYEDLTDSIERDRKDTIKQKTVDLFSLIEQSGYTCQVEWFTLLNINRLKDLYKNLEDIWNYRAQLSEQMKCIICPPNADIFKTPMIEVLNYDSKEDLQELILHEVMKFTQANTDSDRTLGFVYFLASLGFVSSHCQQAHLWMQVF